MSGTGIGDDDGRMLTPREREVLARTGAVMVGEAGWDDDEKSELSGVAGALALFILALLVFGPAFNIMMALNGLSVGYDVPTPSHRIADAIGGIIVSLPGMAAGALLLYRKKRSTVFISIAILWISVLLGQNIIFSGVWTVYLLMSKRVKNTYR